MIPISLLLCTSFLIDTSTIFADLLMEFFAHTMGQFIAFPTCDEYGLSDLPAVDIHGLGKVCSLLGVASCSQKGIFRFYAAAPVHIV